MISADFAPNESAADALHSLITLFSPWSWYRGGERKVAMEQLSEIFKATVVPFLSGRASLKILFEVLALPAGSEVIVQGFTCEAVPLAILKNRLKPVYADIESDTFSLDMESVGGKITPRTKAIILQHSFGVIPKNRSRVLQLAKENNLIIIEDLAHGFNPADWQDVELSDNHVLTLSFGRSKALSSVFGGALVTADRQLTERLKDACSRLPDLPRITLAKLLCYKPLTVLIKIAYNIAPLGKLLHRMAVISGLIIAEISQNEKSGNYDDYLEKKYPNALAKLLLLQLQKFPDTLHSRGIISNLYEKNIGGQTSRKTTSFTRYPLLVKNREQILTRLRHEGIYAGVWYTQPIAPAKLNMDDFGYKMGSCPQAQRICREIINLPTLITPDEAKYIIKIMHI